MKGLGSGGGIIYFLSVDPSAGAPEVWKVPAGGRQRVHRGNGTLYDKSRAKAGYPPPVLRPPSAIAQLALGPITVERRRLFPNITSGWGNPLFSFPPNNCTLPSPLSPSRPIYPRSVLLLYR